MRQRCPSDHAAVRFANEYYPRRPVGEADTGK
jgi:hypothetical protein